MASQHTAVDRRGSIQAAALPREEDALPLATWPLGTVDTSLPTPECVLSVSQDRSSDRPQAPLAVCFNGLRLSD